MSPLIAVIWTCAGGQFGARRLHAGWPGLSVQCSDDSNCSVDIPDCDNDAKGLKRGGTVPR